MRTTLVTLAPDHRCYNPQHRIVSAEKIFEQEGSVHDRGQDAFDQDRTFISPLSHRRELNSVGRFEISVQKSLTDRSPRRRKYARVTLYVLPFNEDALSLPLLTTAAYHLRPSWTKRMERDYWDRGYRSTKNDSIEGRKIRFFFPLKNKNR